MKILALESSCDETALALVSERASSLYLAKNKVYSQIDIHARFGGVVPEVAARQHLDTIIPLLDEVLGKNKLKNIDYLAVTSGPGLIASLLLGIATMKTLSLATGIPLLAINHIEGHIYSNWLSSSKLRQNDKKYFPTLVLTVSGGHTELILMRGHSKYQLVGQTLDDAVGEAYDKVAKMLDLGYPGGPIVSKLAEKGDSKAYNFPRPMASSKDYNFSFSGLKTAVLYTLEKKKKINKKDIADICASFQAAAIDVLVTKAKAAAKEYKVKSIMLGGGVAANTELVKALKVASNSLGITSFSPSIKFTGDNAAMIAAAAYYQIKNKKDKPLKGQALLNLQPDSNWQLSKK